MAQESLTLDLRLLFADQFAQLFEALGQLFELYPDDPRLAKLRIAAYKFTEL